MSTGCQAEDLRWSPRSHRAGEKLSYKLSSDHHAPCCGVCRAHTNKSIVDVKKMGGVFCWNRVLFVCNAVE